MEYFGSTDIGKHRDKNEDYCYYQKDLFIVADGMGGHKAGEVASRLAVETFVDRFKKSLKTARDPLKLAPAKVKNILISSVKEANKEVFKKSVAQPQYYGMGTTFTGCYINNKTANIVHVGDSRLYIKRENDLKLLTSDHTMVGELYRRGEISYEEMFDHPHRNFLTNVIGTSGNIEPDIIKHDLLSGDLIVLCSDGLNSMLKDSQILKIINKNIEIETVTKNLIKGALGKGGLDNITIIVVKI